MWVARLLASSGFHIFTAHGTIHAGRLFVIKQIMPVHFIIPFIGQCLETVSFTWPSYFPVIEPRVVERDESIAVRYGNSLLYRKVTVSDNIIIYFRSDLA